jgi:hypothetical protein
VLKHAWQEEVARRLGISFIRVREQHEKEKAAKKAHASPAE